MATRRDVSRQLTIFLTFTFGFEVAISQLTGNGNKLTIKPDNTVKCSSDLECIEDTCNEGRVCRRLNGEFVQYGIMTCDENSDTPYCNEGLCSKTPRAGCEPIPFLCPTDGVYPDPTNCTRYHVCANGVARINQCPQNNVYDHETNGCKYRKKKSDCVTFNCTGREGRPVVYPQDERIYGICLLGTALILGRCEDYETFNLTEETCMRHCKASGIQPPDPGLDSCRKYVLCAQVSAKKYEPVEMSCACNEGYDENENACSVNAPCLADVPRPLCPEAQNNNSNVNNDDNNNDNGLENNSADNNDNGDNDEMGKDSSTETSTSINNSGNSDNIVEDNNDVNDNSVNSNENNSDNIALGDPTEPPLIINNSSNSDNNDDVSGNDNNDENLNENSNEVTSSNSENVTNNDSTQPPLITNTPGDNNDNNVSNENDNDRDLVTEDNNEDNSGDVAKSEPPLIDNPEDNTNNNTNSVENGNDDVNENLVDSNDDVENNNENNDNSGNVSNDDPVVSPPTINNPDDKNNSDVSNEDNDINDNGNGDDNKDNSDNVNPDKPETTTEEPKPVQVNWFIRIFFDWIIRIVIGQPSAS